MIIIIGRGQGGTRVGSQLLSHNGVATGPLNLSGDMIPPEPMWEATELYSHLVDYNGNYQWSFFRANASEIPTIFKNKVDEYLHPILNLPDPKYFKLPETILCYPWLIRMFPEAKYIYWVRDPRDAAYHISDEFSMWRRWGIKRGTVEPALLSAMGWKYQYDLVNSVPRPRNFITIRYEDFCLNQAQEVSRLGAFLEMNLEQLPNVSADAAYRWKNKTPHRVFHFLEPAIKELGYDSVSVAESHAGRRAG